MAKKLSDPQQSMIANLETKTGKSLANWVRIASDCGKGKHGELIKFLKGEHGLTHGYANLIAHSALKSAAMHSDGEDLVESQYAGKKAALRPIYDALVTAINKIGDDVEFSPKKAYVSVRRKKQFACLQPSTSTRFDLGINLKGVEPTDRLELSGSFNAMVSHRVRITDVKEVDRELIAWLKLAYKNA